MRYTLQISEGDGEERTHQTYDLTEEEYATFNHELDEFGRFFYRGNRITKYDRPRFRVIEDQPDMRLMAAEFWLEEPKKDMSTVKFLFQCMSVAEKRWYSKYKDRPLTKEMLLRCKEVCETVDEVFNFLESDWESIKETPKPQTRLDRDQYASFTPENRDGRFCGRCLSGFLPGDKGLVLCRCNQGLQSKYPGATVRDPLQAR